MNQDLDISDNQIIKTGKLKKLGGRYDLVSLQPKDIPQMMALQDTVFAALPAGQQDFIHHKTPEFLEKHFKHHNIALGIVCDGKLIAQSIIVNPSPFHPFSGMTDMHLDARPDRVTVLQGVIVDPAYRGNNLMSVMVDEWLAIAKTEKRTHALAEVTVENHHSWSVFMKEGLSIHSIGHDDADGSDVYNMHAPVSKLIRKRAKADFNHAAARKTEHVNMSQLMPQKALLRKGYLGTGFDAATKTISFTAPRNAHKPPKPEGPRLP